MEEFKFWKIAPGQEVTIRFLDNQYWAHKIEQKSTQHKAGTLPGCPLCEAGYPVVVK